MRIIVRIAAPLAAVMALGLMLVATGSSEKAANRAALTPIRMAINNSVDSLPIAVAVEQGFFKAHGLNVTYKIAPDITLIPALLGHQFDIGFGVSPVTIKGEAAGLNLAVVSGNDDDTFNPPLIAIVVAKNITSAKQLVGQKIATPTVFGDINLATQAWLAAHGVTAQSSQFVQVATPDMVAQLKAGRVSAVELQDPYISLAEQDGFHNLGDPEKTLSPTAVPGTFWIASHDWATQHLAAVKAFRASLAEAITWLRANPVDAKKLMASFADVPVSLVNDVSLNGFSTHLTASQLSVWQGIMKRFGGFTGSVDFKKLVLS